MRNIGKSGGAASVVLVGLEQEALGSVREVLSAEAVLPNQSVSFGDSLTAVQQTRPDVVIVGFSDAIDAALALAQALSRDHPNITLVALAKAGSADQILAAMRCGYKEFVVLPEDASRLRQAVHDAAFSQAEDEEKGMVIALTGAKGGVGNTTLATHLAAELAGIHRVLIMDLDFGMGDIASMLDLSARDSIADLLPRADRLDERVLTSTVAVHRSKVHVLTAPEDMESLGVVRADDIYAVIDAAAEAYQFVIIDCGAFYEEGVAMALNVADVVVLITTPDVTSVRDSFRRLRTIKALGVDESRIKLVVNRWHSAAYVGLSDIQQNLGLSIAATIAEDARHVEQAINEGKLIREINKNCEAARDISRLVAVLSEEDDDGENADEPDSDSTGVGSFFANLFNRG
ncbi:MAG: AAA family ATPase [Rhodobacterales bacterium]|nr:AAA family ATPase [Rhodobacterales bacterium]